MKPGVLLLLTLLVTVTGAQEPVKQSAPEPEQRVFNKVERVGDGFRTFFMFSASSHEYTIRADGLAESRLGRARQQNFNLKTDRGHIEQVYFDEQGSDLLLLYEVSDKLNGWGYIGRLNQTTFKFKWLTPISGFNLGPALIEGDDLYLTAVSRVAKLDLRSGAYAWQLEDLQQKYASSFQAFQAPWIKGDHVFFKEELAPFKTIEVDKLSGKIITILQ